MSKDWDVCRRLLKCSKSLKNLRYTDDGTSSESHAWWLKSAFQAFRTNLWHSISKDKAATKQSKHTHEIGNKRNSKWTWTSGSRCARSTHPAISHLSEFLNCRSSLNKKALSKDACQLSAFLCLHLLEGHCVVHWFELLPLSTFSENIFIYSLTTSSNRPWSYRTPVVPLIPWIQLKSLFLCLFIKPSMLFAKVLTSALYEEHFNICTLP